MGDLKHALLSWTRTIKDSSSNLVGSTKLHIAIASEEDKKREILISIGKKVQEIYNYGGSLGDAFDDLVKTLSAAEAKLNALKMELEALKSTPAPSSSPPAPLLEAPAAQAENAAPSAVEEQLLCKACGAANDPRGKFCMGCGRIL